MGKRLKVAWISEFPVEWLPDLPEPLQGLPRPHSMSWQRVLLQELEKDPTLELHIFALRKGIARDIHFECNGVSFHVLKVKGLRAPSLYWVDTWALKRHLQELRPDLIHAWGSERGAALTAQRLGYPHVVTVQGLMSWYAELVDFNFHEKVATYLEKKCLPRATLVTTESKFAVEFLKERFGDIRVFQAEHAPNWSFHEIKREPQTKPIRFLFVGYLSERKGVDLIFAALERLIDEFAFELVLVGGAEERFLPKLEQLRQGPLSKCTVIKKDLSVREVAAELARATLMLFPTRADTSPNAVKEAVVAGLPVVASTVGGIPDYVVPGENGYLFESDNLDGFVRSIREAVRHPLFGKGEVAVGTLGRMREYLSPRVMGERFSEAYRLAVSTK